MEKSTQSQQVLEFLRAHRGDSFTARGIAEAMVAAYPDIYAVKARRAGFINPRRLIQQVISEIGASKAVLQEQEPALVLQDLPQPRRYGIPAQDGTAPGGAAAHADAGGGRTGGCGPAAAGRPSEHDLQSSCPATVCTGTGTACHAHP